MRKRMKGNKNAKKENPKTAFFMGIRVTEKKRQIYESMAKDLTGENNSKLILKALDEMHKRRYGGILD